MRRRQFFTVIASALLSTSAQAQQAGGLRRVGVLFPGLLGEERERLIAEGISGELGTEKVNLVIRSAEGDSQLLSKYATEFADSRVDVILAVASGSLEAARRATQTIPIVALDLESDPIADGAAQSLNRPGGNVTGVFFDAPEIASKWIQIIRELVPQIARAGLLYDLHLDQTQLKAGEISAHKVGIATLRLGIDQPDDFRRAFQSAVDAKVDAVLVHSSPIFVDRAAMIADLAREFRLPSIGLFPIYAKVGGHISYGPNNRRDDGIVLVHAHLDAQSVIPAQREQVVHDLEARAVLAPGILLIVDGGEVHEDVEAEVAVIATQAERGGHDQDAASHRVDQQSERQRRGGLRHSRRRPDDAEPIGIVLRAEDRQRQRAARDRQDTVAGPMEDRKRAARDAAAQDADDGGADRVGQAGDAGRKQRVIAAEPTRLYHSGGNLRWADEGAGRNRLQRRSIGM